MLVHLALAVLVKFASSDPYRIIQGGFPGGGGLKNV